MKIPANQLPSALKKSLSSCYLVAGDEPLLVQEALDAIRAKAREDGFDARELYVAGPRFDWNEITAAAGNLSLFAEKRILELQLPTGRPGHEGAPAIIELAQKCGGDLLVVISAPKLERDVAASKWARTVEAAGCVVQVWPVEVRDLPKWIESRMRHAGLTPAGNAVRLIADRVEGNLLAADQEIEKLRLLLGAGAVTADDVDSAVGNSSRFNVYKLADAAVAGDAARAIRILGGVRAEGVKPVLVMWALTRDLRVLARLAENVEAGVNLATAMQKLKVWRSRQAIVRACVGRHAATDFYSLLQLARKADAAAKGRLAVDPWHLAIEILLGLAKGRAQAA